MTSVLSEKFLSKKIHLREPYEEQSTNLEEESSVLKGGCRVSF